MEHSQRMRLIKSKDTMPEMIVRRMVHGMGFRYRLHGKNLPGSPDLVFNKKRKVIFVHGCFWHRHEGCSNVRTPKNNPEFWTLKFKTTVARDASHISKLNEMGWDVLVIWECELKKIEEAKKLIAEFVT